MYKNVYKHLQEARLAALRQQMLACNHGKNGKLNIYHLEDNVWTHTTMVLNKALKYSPETQLCALFHDSGKPLSCVYDKKRDKNIFHNHWVKSGNIFRNYMLNYLMDSNRELLKSPEVILDLFFMFKTIQFHHANQLKKVIRKNLTSEFPVKYRKIYADLRECDWYGRLTEKPKPEQEYALDFDAPETTMKEFVVDHADNFDGLVKNIASKIADINADSKTVVFPIGSSGSGKSTIIAKLIEELKHKNRLAVTRSLDDMRLESYFRSLGQEVPENPDTKQYMLAWNYVKDSKININGTMSRFIKTSLKGEPDIVFVDKMNLKSKNRSIDTHYKNKVKTVALLFFSSRLEDVFKNNGSRNIILSDKVIINTHLDLFCPTRAEFDHILII